MSKNEENTRLAAQYEATKRFFLELSAFMEKRYQEDDLNIQMTLKAEHGRTKHEYAVELTRSAKYVFFLSADYNRETGEPELEAKMIADYEKACCDTARLDVDDVIDLHLFFRRCIKLLLHTEKFCTAYDIPFEYSQELERLFAPMPKTAEDVEPGYVDYTEIDPGKVSS